MPIPLGIFATAGAGGAAAGAFEQISTTILSSDTTSVTFSSLPSTYKHLQIRYAVRGSRAANDDFIALQFNGDTGSNYWYHYLEGTGSSVNASSIVSAENRIRLGNVPAASAATSSFSGGVIDILDYAATTKNKTIRTLNGHHATPVAPRIALRSGLWLNTSAVSSITFLALNGGWVTGSRFSIYGIKG
jgi:hypothetical protein